MKLKVKPRVWVGIKTSVLLGGVLVVALLTPHLVPGHLPLSEGLSQSVVLFFDFLLAFFFFGIYYRDIEKLKKVAVATESRLSDSFRYIGKANVTIELFFEFIRVPGLGLGKSSDKQIVQGLLKKLLVSVLKSRGGVMRVVDQTTLRSVTEFRIATSGEIDSMSLPNSVLRSEEPREVLREGEHSILRSVLPGQNLACLLIFRSSCPEEDTRLALVLLNQLHLLVLLMATTATQSATDLRRKHDSQ